MLFIIVGACWSLPALAIAGVAAVVLLLVRALVKGVVLVAGAHWSGISLRQSFALTLALTPISVSALVLLADLQISHPAFAIMELLRPIVV